MKNDQFHEGSQVLIVRSEESVCPVAVVEKFDRWSCGRRSHAEDQEWC